MPYVARPSWLNGGPDQAEQKPSSSVGASPTPGVASPTPPGSAPTTGALPGVQGTGFVNLSQYLQEGRGQAQAYAQNRIVNPLNQQQQDVSRDATTQANKYAHWDRDMKARTSAQQANEKYVPGTLNPDWEHYVPKDMGQKGITYLRPISEVPKDQWPTYQQQADMAGGLAGKAGADRFRAWQAGNPEPVKELGLAPVPGAPAEPIPDSSLTGRASAVNADKRATGTMAGRGSLFARSAGQGYGYGNFDAFLSGGKPWGGVQNNYPTLWQQIKGNPDAVEMEDDPTTPWTAGTGANATIPNPNEKKKKG